MRITPKPQLITLLTCGSVDLFPVVVVIVVVVSLVINELQLLPHIKIPLTQIFSGFGQGIYRVGERCTYILRAFS